MWEQTIIQRSRYLKLAMMRMLARIRAMSSRERRLVSGIAGIAVIALLAAIAIAPQLTRASNMNQETNLLANGGFEQGFKAVPGCGTVGAQWQCFTNGGAANYGFYDDEWAPTVAEGKHSQLIEINTKGMAAGDNDRYAGLSQTVRVVPGATYQLSLRGMIRTTNMEGDPWRYSVQVGWLNEPNGDWRAVENWTDVGWNSYYDREEPVAFSGYQTSIRPHGEVVTLFVRVWKKWGVAYEELDVNLDSMALVGPSPQPNRPDQGPNMPSGPSNPSKGIGGPVAPMPMQPSMADNGNEMGRGQSDSRYMGPGTMSDDYPVVCGGPDLVYNGSFEHGFAKSAYGDVGRGWTAFTNGGAVNYGFYQEQWDVVVADGHSGQLIEISSKSVYPTDGDRYAGIYQRLEKLQPGAIYELTLRGELRGEGNEEDPYRFAAQYAVGTGTDWRHVDADDWHELDLGTIYKRTEPGPLTQVKVRFKAPATHAVLFIRGWNKWGITNVEMDLNLDAIRLQSCESHGPTGDGWAEMPMERPMGGTGGKVGDSGPDGTACVYVVKPGDTVGEIAAKSGVSADVILRANGISNPNLIYVGQKFDLPGCNMGGKQEPMASASSMQMMPSSSNDGPIRMEPMTMRPETMEPTKQPMPAMGPTSNRQSDEMMRPSPKEPQGEPQRPADKQTMAPRRYTVRQGDMLSQIAVDYGVNVYELARANGIDNMNMLYAGQVLIIP